MAGDGAPRHFHGHDGGCAFQERDHQNPHHVEEGMLFVGGFGHVGRDRPDQSVTQQDAQKCSHQGGGNLVSNFLRRAAESPHGDHDAEHGGDNSQAGQGIGHGAEGGGGLSGILMVNLEVEVEHLVEIEGIDAGNGHAQGVADEIANVVVLEEGGILGKNSAFLRLFYVGFEGHQAVFAGLVEQVVHHFQSVDIGLLAELGGAEDATDSAADLLEDVEGIGDQKSAHPGTTDDNQFSRLNEHSDVAVLHEVASQHGTENDDDADNRKHS